MHIFLHQVVMPDPLFLPSAVDVHAGFEGDDLTDREDMDMIIIDEAYDHVGHERTY